jgi:itaconate CoA-transferase
VKVLDLPALADEPRFTSNSSRVEHQEALDAIVTEVFSRFTAAQVVERLDAAGIANAQMNTVSEFLDHPQLAARN